MSFSLAHSSAQLPMCWFEYGSHRPSCTIESTVSSAPIFTPPRSPRITCGAFDIDSMPPATAISISPAAIARAAPITASSPEPHTLLTVTHGTLCGSPATSAAWRAGAWPTPAGSTMPMWTRPTSPGATPARSSAALIAVAPSRGAGTEASEPEKASDGGARSTDDDDVTHAVGIPRDSRMRQDTDGAPGTVVPLACGPTNRVAPAVHRARRSMIREIPQRGRDLTAPRPARHSARA